MIRFPLRTPRLLIRPLRQDDAEALHELFSDPEAMRFLAEDLPATVDESRQWVETKIDRQEWEGLSLWAVVERETGRVVGDAGLQWEEIDGRREVDLGCRIIRRYWSRGYGTEAAEACLRAGFEQLGLERIVAMTDAGNAAARRVLEKLGMTRERGLHAYGREMALYVAWAADAGQPAFPTRRPR